MPQVWDRRDPRVDYQSAIRLLVAGREQLIDGQTTNLSETGVQVTAWRSPGVGSAVTCELALPGERLQLHGRVVWQRPLQRLEGGLAAVGMGIEFLALSTFDAAVLRHVVGEERDRCHPLRVWLEGLPQPIRAEGRFTPDGVELRTGLPFLRRRSDVEICFSADDPLPEIGELRGVGLDLDGEIPQLLLRVALADDGAALCCDETLVEPGEVIYELTPDQVISSVSVDPTVVTTAAGEIEAAPVGQEPAIEQPAQVEVHGLYETPAREDARTDSDWTMGEPLPHAPQPRDRFWREANQRPHRGWFLALASISLLGLGVGLLLGGDAQPPAKPSATKRPPAIAAVGIGVPRPPAEVAKSTTAGSSARAAVAIAPATPPPAARPAESAEPAGPPDPPDPNLPRVTVTDHRISLALPIEGSVAKARHYFVARPDGVAINLPRGRAKLPYGLYPVKQHGFRSVWVRRRLDGSQVRVFVALDDPPPAVTLTEQAIVVTIARAPGGDG